MGVGAGSYDNEVTLHQESMQGGGVHAHSAGTGACSGNLRVGLRATAEEEHERQLRRLSARKDQVRSRAAVRPLFAPWHRLRLR